MKAWSIIISLMVLLACSKKDTANSTIVLLRVDYSTLEFKGGTTFKYNSAASEGTNINLITEYQAPDDFGNLKISYQNPNNVIFDGSIIWDGQGEINIPASFNAPNTFIHTNNDITAPQKYKFQIINDIEVDIPYSYLWGSIRDLQVVESCLASGKNIGIFLYTPSVGPENQSDWDWFIVLNK